MKQQSKDVPSPCSLQNDFTAILFNRRANVNLLMDLKKYVDGKTEDPAGWVKIMKTLNIPEPE